MKFEPKWIAWEITRRCNLKCVHCRSSSELEVIGHPDFSLDEAKRVLDDIHGYADPVMVLSGGEPLLRPDVFDIAAYGPAVQWVIMVFMFLAGVNFVCYFHLIRGRVEPILKNSEVRLYVGILLLSTLVIALFLRYSSPEAYATADGGFKAAAGYEGWDKTFRDAAFQSVSLMTTTGYCTANFDAWPHLCRFWLVMLMVIGSCGGSTAGGMKVVRLLLAYKIGVREILRLARPRTVFNIRIEGRGIPEEVVGNTAGFFVLYFMTFGLGTLVMLLLGLDFETGFSSVLACISNIGPGLGAVGAVETYAHVPDAGKLFLSLCMLLGRLELYSVLLLFIPLIWKK